MAVFSKGVLELQDNEYNDKIESLHWGTPNFDVVEDKGGREHKERGASMVGLSALLLSFTCKVRQRGEGSRKRTAGMQTELRAMGVPINSRERKEMKGKGGQRKGQPSCFNCCMS